MSQVKKQTKAKPVSSKSKATKPKSGYSRAQNYSSSIEALPYSTHKKAYQYNTKRDIQSFNRGYSGVSDDARAIIDMILDPFVCTTCPLLPTAGMSSNYKSVNNIDTPVVAGLNTMLCVVRPTLSESILLTNGGNVAFNVANLTQSGLLGDRPQIKIRFQADENDFSFEVSDMMQFVDGHVAIPQPFATNGRYIYWFRGQGQATPGYVSSIRAYLYFPEGNPAGFNTQLLVTAHRADGTPAYTMPVVGYDSTIQGMQTARLSNNQPNVTLVEGWSFQILSETTSFRRLIDTTCYLYLYDDAAPTANDNWALPMNTYNLKAYDNNGAETIQKSAEGYFVSAQSLLVTYNGSSLSNAGRISGAKLPSFCTLGSIGGSSVPISDSAYQFLASLSKNNMSGPSKKGFYGFNLMQDIWRDYAFRPVELNSTYNDKPYLACSFSTDPTTPQPFRVQVSTVIQFTSNSNIFRYQPSPYLGDDYYKLLHLLSIINACYENDSHREKLTEALKKVGGKIWTVMKNPQTYQTIAKIASMLL